MENKSDKFANFFNKAFDFTKKAADNIQKGASSATMSQKCAAAIDLISKINASASMEKKAIKEHSTQMVLEIEF